MPCKPGKKLVITKANPQGRCRKKCDSALHHRQRYSNGRCRPRKSLYDYPAEYVRKMRLRTARSRLMKQLRD